MDVIVRSAMDNSLLFNVAVNWAISSEGDVTGSGTTGSDGVAFLQVDGAHLPTDVELTASLDGYENEFLVVHVDAGDPDSHSILLSLTPEGREVLKLNWLDMPKDLDIFVNQINTTTGASCLTYYRNRRGCDGLSLNVDNRWGGHEAPESVAWDEDYRGGYTYLVYVNNWSKEKSLAKSKARIAYGDVHLEVPEDVSKLSFRPDPRDYWFVGCIDGNGRLSTEDSALMIDKPPNCLCTGGCEK